MATTGTAESRRPGASLSCGRDEDAVGQDSGLSWSKDRKLPITYPSLFNRNFTLWDWNVKTRSWSEKLHAKRKLDLFVTNCREVSTLLLDTIQTFESNKPGNSEQVNDIRG
eukprot:g45999.t1